MLDECYAANGDEPITYFEITTCAALLAMSRTPADYTLLEVGLGGRLDATNVIAQPALTVIIAVLRALQSRYDLPAELTRKIVHVSLGLVTLAFPWLFDEAWPVVTLAAATIAVLAALRWVPAIRERFGSVLGGVVRLSHGELESVAVMQKDLCSFLFGARAVLPGPILPLATRSAAPTPCGRMTCFAHTPERQPGHIAFPFVQ